jgi:plastocyanin
VSRADYDVWLADQVAKANATPPPAPSGEEAGPVIQLTAQNIAFTEQTLDAPADKPFTIHFSNNDNAVPHNVEIKDANGGVSFQGDTFSGVAEKDYAVPALANGTYLYVCTVHPNMTGNLTVK